MGTGMTNNNLYFGTMYYSDSSPVPELLTESEAIRFLRLDVDGPKNPAATLKHYRDLGYLRATRVGQYNRYLKTELIRFLNLLTERNDKNIS